MFWTCSPARINGDVLTTLPTLYSMAEKFFLTNLFALLSPTAAKPGRTVNIWEISSTTSPSSSEKKPKKVLPFVPHQAHFASNFASSPVTFTITFLGKEAVCDVTEAATFMQISYHTHIHSLPRELMRGAFVRSFALSARDISESIWNENLVSEEFPDFWKKTEKWNGWRVQILGI